MINMGVSREAKFSSVQLQKKFKHAKFFGVRGNYNKVNGEKLEKAIAKYLKNTEVIPIQGTQRGGEPVLHFYHPETKINVMLDRKMNFISGWRLTPEQSFYLLEKGNIK